MSGGGWLRLLGATWVLAAGCHLALGLESAETLETTTTPPPECETASACDDDNPCTDDSCREGSCVNTPESGMAASSLQTSEDCLSAVCEDGALIQVPDNTDVASDNNPCTQDVCESGVPSHLPVAGGTPCSTGVCSGAGACVECFDNGQCVLPDTCGGGGSPFACGCTPLTCTDVALTCGNAPNGCVGALNCDTGAMDGDETDVDCGGDTATCPRRCGDGKACDGPSDCASGTCTAGFCVGN